MLHYFLYYTSEMHKIIFFIHCMRLNKSKKILYFYCSRIFFFIFIIEEATDLSFIFQDNYNERVFFINLKPKFSVALFLILSIRKAQKMSIHCLEIKFGKEI